MGNNQIKMDIRPLMCRLTEDELEEQGKILTELLQSKMDLEIEKSSSAKHFTDEQCLEIIRAIPNETISRIFIMAEISRMNSSISFLAEKSEEGANA